MVKRVKADTKTMQLSHEEEKRRMNSQLKTIREQEEAIQAVVRLKDAELAKLVAHSEQLLLSKQQI